MNTFMPSGPPRWPSMVPGGSGVGGTGVKNKPFCVARSLFAVRYSPSLEQRKSTSTGSAFPGQVAGMGISRGNPDRAFSELPTIRTELHKSFGTIARRQRRMKRLTANHVF
jgi:hypothetical protein